MSQKLGHLAAAVMESEAPLAIVRAEGRLFRLLSRSLRLLRVGSYGR
jgi:hypothetical protein